MENKDVKKTGYCSLDEELMVCAATRYAVGRHTYMSTLSKYIAKEYYNRLNDEQLEKISQDVRESITHCLSYGSCSLRYESSVPYEERDGLTDLLIWMQENVKNHNDLKDIEYIEVYKDGYSPEYKKKYHVLKIEPTVLRNYSQMDIDDLLEWDVLANLFDKSKHVTLTVKNNDDTISDIICVKCWARGVEEDKERPGIYTYKQWSWVQCWRPVKELAKGKFGVSLNENYIVNQ